MRVTTPVIDFRSSADAGMSQIVRDNLAPQLVIATLTETTRERVPDRGKTSLPLLL